MKPRFRQLWPLFLSCVAAFTPLAKARLQAQTVSSTTWSVTIVLPGRLVAGQPATLAVLGVDGRLAGGIKVDLGNGQQVTSDETGRAFFSAPASGAVLVARASGASAASLIDPALPAGAQPAVLVAPALSLREPFSICASGFRGDANASHVRINGEPALVLAPSQGPGRRKFRSSRP